MQRSWRIWHAFAIAGWSLSIAACGDPTAGPLAQRHEAADLSVQFRDVGSGMDAELSDGLVQRIASRSRTSQDVKRWTSRLEGESVVATILEHLEDAGFSVHNNSRYAFGSGWMKFFGTNGRVSVSADLKRRGVSMTVFPAVSEVSFVEPGIHDTGKSAIAYIQENCGHTVAGFATYRVWGKNNLPTGQTGEFMPAEASHPSDLARQSDCAPEKKEENVTTSGAGGEDTRLTNDEGWYLCRYEVWYDQWGNELSRRLMGCWPL